MSTKTTFKRIALVAVASLSFGVLTSVAPASATAEVTASSLVAGTAAPSRAGVTSYLPVTATFSASAAVTDTLTVAAKVISGPSGSLAYNSTTSGNGNSAGAILNITETSTKLTDAAATFTSFTNASAKFDAAATEDLVVSGAVGTTSAVFLIAFTPDIAGTYQILVSTGNSAYTAGDASTTLTVTTAGVPASIVLTPINAASAEGSNGSLIKVSLKDAAGLPTVLGVNEGIALSDSSASATTYELGSTDEAIGPEDFSAGVAYIRSVASSIAADLDLVVTATGSGLIAGLVSNTTVSFAEVAGTSTVSSVALTSSTGYATAAASAFTATTEKSTSKTSHGFTVTLAAEPDADESVRITVTDNDGAITGASVSLAYDIAVDFTGTALATDDSETATFTLAASLGTDKQVQVAGPAGDTYALVGGTPGISTVTATNSIARVAIGGSVALTATAKNQWAVAMANQSITITVTGRNATTTTVTASSDANGMVSYTLADAATAVGSSSVVTFAGTTGSGSTTVYWGDVTVGTVTVTGGASEDTVAYPAAGATTKAITTASTGANGATTTFTATVKDANGNLLSGVPVTWTVDKTTAGITKTASADSASCFTGSAGTCTTTVFSWAAPSKVTVTATAGGKTGTGYQNFVNAATDARVLSATVSGAVVTAKVVDRFGNAVAGVTVAAKTSNGYFGSGSTSTTGVTTTDGTVGFAVQAASATVTLTVDSATYTQTDDASGYVGATAVTAAVAGTTTGTGASLAPAGVNSVTVEASGDNTAQAAADAAAEATDAANAATDAANAAAEAADAATAAAQDAADAVAALSTQVSEMVNALKKQITALTNLVIKIQKKVRA